jgi:hypothetical protein
MSDYWHAVGRAALGLPGTAEPRRRAIFEPEDGSAEPVDLMTREEETEAPPPEPAAARDMRAATREEPARAVPPRDRSEPAPAARAAPTLRETRVEVRSVQAEAPRRVEPATPGAAATAIPQPSGGDERRGAAAPVAPSQPAPDRPPATPDTITAAPLQRDAPTPAQPATIIAAPAPREAPAPDDAAEPAVVVAQPLASAPPVAEAATHEPPPLVIEIGQIEIRIASETPAPPARPPRETKAVLALSDYLAQRSKADR